MPSSILSDSIVYGDALVMSAAGFPNGLTRSIRITHSGKYPASPFLGTGTNGHESIGCSIQPTVSPTGYHSFTVQALTGLPNSPAYVNIGIPELEPFTAVEHPIDCCDIGVWVSQGCYGYRIVDLSDRPAAPGEIKLGTSAIVIPELVPTMPEVLLRLWVEFRVSNGTDPIGLDLPSIVECSAYCRSKGYFYRGDVSPDYLEAWIYQAALSHGLSARRSRLGISLKPIEMPTAPAKTLITFGNAANISYTWNDRPTAAAALQLVIKTNDRTCCEPYTPVGNQWAAGNLIIEELLGVRSIDTTHITAIEALILSQSDLTQVIEFDFKGDRSQGFALEIGQVIQVNSGNLTRRSGTVTSATANTVTPSWDSVIMSGYTDSIGPSALTDLSKIFLGIVATGDILLIQNGSGQTAVKTISAVTDHSITIVGGFESVPFEAGYKIFDLTQSPSDILSLQEPGQPILNMPLSPMFDFEAKRVAYRTTSPVGTGASISIGKPSYFRVESVEGANIKGVGVATA
jgi:hypothetical protein